MTDVANNVLKSKLDDFFKKQPDQSKKAQNDADIFKDLYGQYLDDQHFIDWNSWKFIKKESQVTIENIAPFDESRVTVLNKLAVIKLNGGLGTTMGCKKAKSLIEVRDGFTFMDLAVLEHDKMCKTFGVTTPLYLMNSFYTDDDTNEYLKEKGYKNVRTFVQSKCPRLNAQTKLPIEDDTQEWGDDAWCPPGHGNIFQSLQNSGVLDQLLAEGREIVFIANIDNTGANTYFPIVQLMVDQPVDYIMECTNKTKVDIKGGTLIEINNQMMHLEMPQVPPEHLPDFCSTKVFKIFNTNNIWVNLSAIKRLLPNIRSEIIVNKKKVRGRDVLQLEFSIGGCIKNFTNALCVHVQRNRFRPVKNLGDLLSLRSSIHELNRSTYTIHHNHDMGDPPVINLDPKVYSSVEQLDKRFPYSLNMRNCTEFNVSGDVYFGRNVRLHGRVTIRNEKEEPIHLPNDIRIEEETKIFR
ncbi:unnamed protein product [Caenorhabditis sp. 36 PRJEB53466]|nr:unnamed protein product [Caenorhabditis sp. 36 PRJEB53466]